MLSQEIGVSSNLVSYGKRKPARFLETVTLCEGFRGNFQKNQLQSLLSYGISAYLFLCLHLFNILVHLFSILLSLCNTIFSFSFKHNLTCSLCLNEKLKIVLHRDSNMLNRRTKILNKCRHKNKYALILYDSKDQSRFF